MNPRRLRRALAVVSTCGIMGVGPSASAGHDRPSYITRCGLINAETGARTCSYTFVHSREVETFVVPPSREPVEITAVGAPGLGEETVRSRGARVSGSFPLLSGTLLFVTVGGDGYYDGYNGGQPGTDTAGGAGGGHGTERGGDGTLGRGGHVADRGGGGGGGGFYGGGGGGGCFGGDDNEHLCAESQPGSGGGGSSLVPSGGAVAVSDSREPSITITVTQYG